jgi:tripeptidyl-peptidase-2
VWHDGATWRAALDTSDLHALSTGDDSASSSDSSSSCSKGALADATPLADYAIERRYGVFDETDIGCAYAVKVGGRCEEERAAVCVAVRVVSAGLTVRMAAGCAPQVYDEGNTLSIVVDAGAHGTHVGVAGGAASESEGSRGPRLLPAWQRVNPPALHTRCCLTRTPGGWHRGCPLP